MKRAPLVLIASVILLAGCHKKDNPANPVSSTPQPPAGQTNPPTGGTGGPSGGGDLVIFSDELRSGGGAFMYPTGDNQTLSFADVSNPVTAHSIRYAWNGQDAGGQHGFVGFDLMHVPALADYTTTAGKDLRAGKYTRVTFDARGSLATDVVLKVEVADDGVAGAPPPCIVFSTNGDQDEGGPAPCMTRGKLSAAWQQFSIPVTAAALASVKDYFKATFIYKNAATSTSSGGTAYFDDIRYRL